MPFARPTVPLVLALAALATGLSAQTTRLESGKTIQDDLYGGQTRAYSVTLRAGQYLRAVVTQPVPVVLIELYAPGEKKALVVDTRDFSKPVRILWVADAAGAYRISVSVPGQKADASHYEIKLEELRAAGTDDRKRVEAERLFAQGLSEARRSAYDRAVLSYDRALALYRDVKDREREADALTAAGSAYGTLSQNDKAKNYYEQALTITREIEDRKGERAALNNLGILYRNLSQYEKAIGYQEQALAIAREIKDRRGEGGSLNNLGVTYINLSQYPKAIGYFEQNLAIAREIKDRSGERLALNSLGVTYGRDLSQPEKAIGYLEQALVIAREMKDRAGERGLLNNLGVGYKALSQYEKALSCFEQALAIAREVKDRQGERQTLSNLGTVYTSLGQDGKAISCHEQALAIAREVKDRRGESLTLIELGKAYEHRSQFEKVIAYYEQALAIEREIKNRNGEGGALNYLGFAYHNLSQYEKAIGYYEQALAIFREVKDRRGEGRVLTSLGIVYTNMGRLDKANGYYERALAMTREIKDRRGEGRALTNLGWVCAILRQYGKAIGYHEQALAIAREAKDRGVEGWALTNLGFAYNSAGQYDKAIGSVTQALAVHREVRDRRGEGLALNNLGSACLGLRQFEKAIGYFQQGLAISREVKDRRIEAFELTGLMDAWSASGKPRLAVFYGKQAVNTTQSIRSGIRDLSQDLQQGFLKINERKYHRLAELLIAQGRLAEAEQVLGLSKEEEYFDYVRRDATEGSSLNRRADLAPDEAEYEKRYGEAGDRLMAIGMERGELLAKKTLTVEQSRRLVILEQDLAAGNQAFEHFLGDLAQHFSAKPEMTSRIENLRETQGIMEDLRELPAGTVAIYTVIGEDKFHAILRTTDAQKAYEYPIKAADLNRKVLEFRQVIQNPKLDPRPLARELYKILIGGMAEDLRQAKAQTLMWSLDGALRYVPLAALYDGKQYLIEQYRVSVMTLASNTRLLGAPSREWTAAGFGATATLPSVSAELAGIITTKPGDGGALSGEIKVDGQFTQPAMRQMLLKRYPVVHIASHFRFQPGDDAQSFLLLGDGGHLSMAELKTSANLFGGVQLLTLSACNTGVGDGKEVEGFGALAQRQGAKAVIASLWPVADESTSLLMPEFYRIRETSPGMTKLEALRQAQLKLLRGEIHATAGLTPDRSLVHEPASPQAPSFTRDPKAPYAHPYFWAPFFLMGNWL